MPCSWASSRTLTLCRVTVFLGPYKEIMFTPKKDALGFWYNLERKGSRLKELYHGGWPVVELLPESVPEVSQQTQPFAKVSTFKRTLRVKPDWTIVTK